MDIYGILFLALVVWCCVEYGCTRPTVRLAIQLPAMLALGYVVYSFAVFATHLQHNFETNHLVKNLSQSLVTISASVDYDHQLMQQRLRRLDSQVIPTYETLAPTHKAVEEFLTAYEIAYDPEMPIEDTALAR